MIVLRRLLVVLAAALTLALAAAPAAAPTYVGANYSHWRVTGPPTCSADDTGILAYWNPTVVRQQLTTMKANGLTTLRIIIWHMTDPTGHRWGVIPSDLRSPYRSNLTSYLREVKRANFRLEIAFGPMWTNGPYFDVYDPNKLEENWRFIRSVRSLAREYGPSRVRFDLLSEGVPSTWWPYWQQMEDYVKEIWRRYTKAYGARDATVSMVGESIRIQKAKQILVPAPGFWQLTLPFDPVEADAVVLEAMTTLGTPLVAGETAYEDVEIGNAIRPYGLESILQWPQTRDRPCDFISESPPYTADAYK